MKQVVQMQHQPPWSKMGATVMHPETMDRKINLVEVFMQLCKVFKYKLVQKYLQCKYVIIYLVILNQNTSLLFLQKLLM